MQFNVPVTGDTREISKFTLFPTKVGRTVYWLERIRIHQSYNTRNFNKWNNDYIIREKSESTLKV